MDTVVGRMIPMTILALPGALILWVALAAWRRRRAPALAAVFTAGLDTAILLVAGLVAVLVSAPVAGGHTSTLHLLPGQDLTDLFNADDADAVWQVAGNLVLLSPLGALCPLRIRALRPLTRLTLAAVAVSITIETVQYLIHAGRVTSTDDVLLNTIGATASARLARSLWTTTHPIPHPRRTRDSSIPDPDPAYATDH
ncbi:VanZ family protein [Amycolatopsis sp. NBC_01488]|uniref:VanZ family protein n=1 Tax=Amycolatopsis sp. NBC_01488 TaxID=2903563 RepID=UPI002E2CEFCA|nr:VanZ family protein [Amycolatopsis sp. NBC_01488]